MKTTFQIAEISFSGSSWDFSTQLSHQNSNFEVHRYGANYSVSNIKRLIANFRDDVDAFSITSLPPNFSLHGKSYVHKHYYEVMNIPVSIPLCDGAGLRELLNIERLSRLIASGEIDLGKRFYFPLGTWGFELVEYLRKKERAEVFFSDLFFLTGAPAVVKPFKGLMSLTKIGAAAASFLEVKSQPSEILSRIQASSLKPLINQLKDAHYIVADLNLADYLTKYPGLLEGKTLIHWSRHAGIEKKLDGIVGLKGRICLSDCDVISGPYFSYGLLESALRLQNGKQASLSLSEWAEMMKVSDPTLQFVKELRYARKASTQSKALTTVAKLQKRLTQQYKPDFAFVVHALSHSDFTRAPVVKHALKALPSRFNDSFDRLVGKLPPVVYGHIDHIQSQSTGREVKGIIYGLFSTPKVMKESPAEVTYAKIQQCIEHAAERGAKIVGLGAYTKVIGDAGVTISLNSPIPVTTGNSLSASATLWALHDIVKRFGFLKLNPDTGLVRGVAMVIGATGSIGRVSAHLMSLVFEKLIVVAPRLEKLEQLKTEIKSLNPKCEIICATSANDFAHEVDALVTATSAYNQKVIDVMKLKPGCIVCDCSRPLDFTIEDAVKRPDILIMESGEVDLPGPYTMTCDLGLPGKSVYACLAETAVLALEEKYETFTLGRDIEWTKVKEIYKLSTKHGLKLSHIQSHMGAVTDREINLIKELAISKRKGMRYLST